MSSSSLLPFLDLEISDMAATAWIEVVRRAVKRADEISRQRTNYEKITNQDHDDWPLLHRFEYNHFYNAWVGVAFRFRACGVHSENFTTLFQKTQGTAQGGNLYREDDALFGFFVKGLSTLESFYYSLYALGALIATPAQVPSVPPSVQFPLLTYLPDPARRVGPRWIDPKTTYRAYTQVFSGLLITELLGRILDDEMYQAWQQTRNVLAHRVASAGRTILHQGPFGFPSNEPLSVTPSGMDLPLNAATTASRYTWLRETINIALEETAAFAAQQLLYTEDQLAQWVPLPSRAE
jgi:hypothetical protein